ncbi:hypothetical protein CJU80_08090 [Pseudomonas fragi]|nr:hypothetical protein CJF37_12260 [Pseudomonas fragi]PAA04436.1 hypothetical protein CJU76_07115 [Pseudomonas fragi]PAA15447.1 hypothetical protein CJU74_12390 [Pseudomonas fragi]PAA19933.1 hypothetical protein CJU77_17640 [Pseudomonas fragi]PAA42943.1 hypothetical protein CJU80_08090 [Pseudomonas fragi]
MRFRRGEPEKNKAEGEAPQLALQSCTDEAKAAMLAKQNEDVRCVHRLNPNHWRERWQAYKKY